MNITNGPDAVFRISEVWAQIDPRLLDAFCPADAAGQDQDVTLAQSIKADILKKIGSRDAATKKASRPGYVKYALMAATVVVVLEIGWLLVDRWPLKRTSPTIAASTHEPSGQPTKPDLTGTAQAAQTTSMTSKATQAGQATTRQAISPDMVVVADQYPDLGSYMAPEQGQILITSGVKKALDHPANTQFYFFVQLYILPAEQYDHPHKDYVYNGRSIGEWEVLTDLSNGTYPYSEYNGDHGGQVTREQWEQEQAEAKKLDAQENYDAANAEYLDKVWPGIVEAQARATAGEIERLALLGYDVFMYETWSYAGSNHEKKSGTVAAGLLTWDQLLNFPASSLYGYMIDWVHNGDGIVNWSAE